MAKTNKIGYVFMMIALLMFCCPNLASAAPIIERSVQIGSSAADANNISYDFTFTVPSSTNIKSVSFTPCMTANGVCGAVAGFDASLSTLTSQPTNLGDASGWTADGTQTVLRLKNVANLTSPTALVPTVVKFSGVHNPSAINSTFYIRIATFSDNTYTNLVDSGVVATSMAGQIAVSLAIDEQLTFSLAASTVNMSTPTVSSAGTGSSSMTVSTNAANGYSISYSGATLASGLNTITPMSSLAASLPNSKQFGLNLMQNTNPIVGASKTGLGSGMPSAGYNTVDQFKFVSGDILAATSIPTNTNTFTASYVANADGLTPAGIYSTVLNYIATANF